jgi:transcriptional regulator GlxA family with amidase domain
MIVPDSVVPLTADVTGHMQVTHRRLLVAAHDSEPMLIEELVVTLLAAAVSQSRPQPVSSGRPGTGAARRRLVEDARTLLSSDPTSCSVVDLARRIGTSPHHLSRVFHAATGMTLSAFRTRLRLHRAMEMLSDSAHDRPIAQIAAATGFADQAHLARAFRRYVGMTPTALRNDLHPREPSSVTRNRTASAASSEPPGPPPGRP